MSTKDQEARRDLVPDLPAPGESSVLVGRESERTTLAKTLDRALAGHGAVVLISGEAGIGKTSLGNCAIDQAKQLGGVVLSGAAYDLSITPPYGPWLDLINRFPVSESLPQLPPLLADPQRLNVLDSPETLHATVTTFLQEVAETAPMVVILEDLHWSDQASLDMLRFVARSIRGHRILLILTYRDDELTRDHPLYLALPNLVRETQAVRLNLKRLSPGEISTLISNCYTMDSEDVERLSCHLHSAADGNPLFIQEKLRQLELDGALEPENDGWRLGEIDDQAVPELVQQMVTARLARVRQSTMKAIQIAAVLGQQVPMPLWERFLTPKMRESALDEAVYTGLLHVSSQHISFHHALVREAVHAMIPLVQRRQLHLDIACYFLEQNNPDPDVVAFHLREADDKRAGEWLIRAGEMSERRHAWQEAVDRYTQAVEAISHSGPDHERLAWLMLRIGELLRFANPEKANEWLYSAQEHARNGGLQDVFAYAQFAAGQNLCNLGEPTRGLRDIRLALRTTDKQDENSRLTSNLPFVGDNPAWDMSYARMIGSYAYWLTAYGYTDESQNAAEPAVPSDWKGISTSEEMAAYAKGVPAGTRNIFLALGHSRALRGDPDAARTAFELALEINRLTDFEPHNLVVSNQAIIGHHLPYATDDLVQRAQLMEIVEQDGRLSRGMFSDMFLPGYECLLLREGRWDELDDLWRENPEPTLFPYWSVAICTRASMALNRGNPDDAKTLLSYLLPGGPDTSPERHVHLLPGEAHRIMADLALIEQNTRLAREWMVAHDHWLDWSGAVPGCAEGLLSWSRINLAEGNLDKAHELAEQARQQAESPRQPMALIAIRRFLGELATTNGDVEVAADHLQSSLGLAESCQLPFERALSLLSLAELEIARGNDDCAATALNESIRICSKLGARPTLNRARQLEEAQGTSRKGASYGLSDREREVLELIVQGLTDRQIATQLYISPRTVMRHVTNILRKLDVESRTAAAAKAVSEELI